MTAAVVVAALAVVGFGGQLLYQEHQKDVAAKQALAAAQKYILKLVNFDGETIEGKYQDLQDGSTGEFREKYGRSSQQLHQRLRESHATARGTIVEAWVKKATPVRVVVLMLIDQSVRASESAKATIERSRVKMVMTKVDGRWLASKVRVI
ncbi:MAG: hypothetical protein PHQ28_10210 [Mycobacterium sp.]|nr:hypothetical protein [Mycobacterium sp.]